MAEFNLSRTSHRFVDLKGAKPNWTIAIHAVSLVVASECASDLVNQSAKATSIERKRGPTSVPVFRPT